MDLTKTKLTVGEKGNYSSIPLYLVISKGKKLLITSPALASKRRDLAAQVREKNLEPGQGYTRKNGVKIFRVHPNLLSRKQRKKLIGEGEKGKLREQFIEDGLTATEQRHRAKETTAMVTAEWAKKTGKVRKERRRLNEKRSDYETPESKEKEPRFEGLGVKDIAKAADLEPIDVRKFLRRKKIGKRGGRYAFTEAEAKKVTKAVKKHYA